MARPQPPRALVAGNNLTKGSANTSSDAFVGQFDQAMIGIRTGW